MLQALVLQAGGETDRAMARLEELFTLAEPEGFTRIFVDEGRPMVRLLLRARSQEASADYAGRLLAAFSPEDRMPSGPSLEQRDQSGLVEPLSPRELEVLELIARGHTNREIAGRLFLSLHTIKVHARNIYGKLGASNRTQAVARARDLGVLSDS